MTAIESKLSALDRLTAYLDKLEQNQFNQQTVITQSTSDNKTDSVVGESTAKEQSGSPGN